MFTFYCLPKEKRDAAGGVSVKISGMQGMEEVRSSFDELVKGG